MSPGAQVALVCAGFYLAVIFYLGVPWQPKVKKPEEEKHRDEAFPTAKVVKR